MTTTVEPLLGGFFPFRRRKSNCALIRAFPFERVTLCRPTKVLLIDDDRVTRIRICALLEEWGHQTAVAVDGLEGLALFHRERPDLVLTDWLMPGLDGWNWSAGCVRRRRRRAASFT